MTRNSSSKKPEKSATAAAERSPRTIGYIRVSTDKQDASKQKHLLLEYAQQHRIMIDKIIEVEISSRENLKTRKIDLLFETLVAGDRLIVAELSRLGRNMFETLNIINDFAKKGISIIFIRQPELSIVGPQSKLLLAIYSYFAESERDFISLRTKQGLAAARASGITIGRPKGARGKKMRRLDPFKAKLAHLLQLNVSLCSSLKIINEGLTPPISYTTLRYYISHEPDLKKYRPRQPGSRGNSGDTT